MRKILTIFAVTGSMTLAGCVSENQERQVTGAVIGGGLGLITSKVLGADNDWVVVSTLAGAAAGASAVATRNESDFESTALTPYHPLDLVEMLAE